ncbi:MAG: preprotein translocase subunit SecG [Geminicoccaceae bacterium]
MTTVLLVIHLLLALALVGVILLQRSDGGALSGLGGGNMGGLMTTRGTANLLTRTTAILAAGFLTTSLVLAILAGKATRPGSILDLPAATTQQAPAAPAEPAAPAAPAEPAAPIAK